jgi:hypothetical protein
MGGNMNLINTHVPQTKTGTGPAWEPLGSTFEAGRFLTVTAILTREGMLSAEPGFHVDYRRSVPRPEFTDEALKNALVLEFLDERGELLTQRALPFAPVCVTGAGDLGMRMVAASIPYPADYHFIRYRFGDRLLKEVARPKDAPTVKFIRTPDSIAADNEIISWEVAAAPEMTIRSLVMFSHDDGHSWQPVVPPSSNRANSVSVRFANLPGGRARLKALATDGFATAASEAAPFDVPIKGVRPSILSPAHGAVVPAESTVWFHGQAYDYEKRNATQDELLWCSSRDGELGRGAVIAAPLSPGVHEVTLKCCGTDVTINIVAKPDRRSGAIRDACGK